MLRRATGGAYPGRFRPGKVSPRREVPAHIPRPDYAETSIPGLAPGKHVVREGAALEAMRRAAEVSRAVLDSLTGLVRPGVTTDELDAVVHAEAIALGAYPSPLNYRGFPKSCAISVNDVVCHGIPDDTPLREGDIVNVDVSCFYGGVHGDLSEMFVAGEADPGARRLVRATHDAWQAAIGACGPGVPYTAIGEAIEAHAEAQGFSVVRQFCGHGIGESFHAYPNILHYRNRWSFGDMRPGHVFTIEPMINEGSSDVLQWPDGWTVTTADGRRSAQFEHTLVITDHGAEPLTARTANSQPRWWAGEERAGGEARGAAAGGKGSAGGGR